MSVADVDMDGLTPDTREAWEAFRQAALEQLGFDLVPRSARRTCAAQAEQWAIGRSGPNDTRAFTTRAQGCRSWHVTGRAVDFFVYINGKKSALSSDYTKAGLLAEQMGLVWGGRFPGFGPNGDEGHVEYHPGLTMAEVCPDPTQCVDVPSTPAGGGLGGWGIALGVAVGVVAIAGAAAGGAALAARK